MLKEPSKSNFCFFFFGVNLFGLEFFATWVTFVTKIQESNVKFAKQKEAEEKQKKRDEAAAKKTTGGPPTRGMNMGALAAEAASRGAARGTRGASRGTSRGGAVETPAAGEPAEPVNPFAGALRGRGTRGRGGAASKMVADSLFDDLTAGNVFKK